MKPNKRLSIALLTTATALLLSACGGSDNDTPPEKELAKVSFAVSDAPVDSAQQVVIAFDQIELVKHGQENIVLDVTGENGATYRQLDLMQYQGTDSAMLISDQTLPLGTYDNLILHILDESSGSDLSYVVNERGQIPLKQPSQKLQLGSFTVDQNGVQRFTIEFNLRQSLVENRNGNRFNLKPHGVKILRHGNLAALSGKVDINLFSAGQCQADSGNFMYLYSGHDLDSGKLADNYDALVNTATLPEAIIAPYASTDVHWSDGNYGSYSFGYLPEGDYTVAFTCSGENDDPEQYQAFTIPNPAMQLHEISIVADQNVQQDFTDDTAANTP
ncbi:DUF4382 domain-containing protein [Shewanella sp. YIC-542]|uniref:DUF4382 domain-containing protein n=1 Tax=Shewanella mytili TaxID=3377111 RepID=UPI00398EE4EB